MSITMCLRPLSGKPFDVPVSIIATTTVGYKVHFSFNKMYSLDSSEALRDLGHEMLM